MYHNCFSSEIGNTIMDKNYILHKYLNNEASPEEIKILQEDSEFATLLKIAQGATQFEVPGFAETENQNALKSRLHTPGKLRKLTPWKQIIRVAAVVAIAALTYVFLMGRETSISTDIAQKETIVLPDQSEVVLNAKSDLSYQKKNWDTNRSLKLEGEAYFKVAKGKRFEVNTPTGVVAVLGTQFNVYSRGTDLYVKCFEGLVSVAYLDTLVKLPAGKSLKVARNTLISLEDTQDRAPSWIAFESTFQNATLDEVLNELMRQYAITISSKPEVSKKFTGSFTHKNLNVALRSVCEPLELDFEIADDEVTLYAKSNN